VCVLDIERVTYYLFVYQSFLKLLKITQNKSWVKGFATRGGSRYLSGAVSRKQ
jgi:hypothetical protein